ncbi:hypothetical protein, partial [Mycobacterium tuberculosis]
PGGTGTASSPFGIAIAIGGAGA